MTQKRIAILICAIILITSGMIGGTLAYLTDIDTEINTFTIGKIDIGLAETNWNDITDGKNMIPGNTYLKNPTVTATEGESYMRIKVEFLDSDGIIITNAARIAMILQTIYYDSTAIGIIEASSYTLANLSTYTSVNEAVFDYDDTRVDDVGVRYYNFITGDAIFSTADGDKVLFTSIVVPADFSNDDIATLGIYSIKMTAQAVQSGNVTNAAAGYAILDTEFPG